MKQKHHIGIYTQADLLIFVEKLKNKKCSAKLRWLESFHIGSHTT